MRASDRGATIPSRTSSSPRCAPSSAAMSSQRADACVFVIFGASGDLTRSKLLPSIFNLVEDGLLPEEFAILGVARPQLDQDTYRKQMREQVREVEGEPLEPEKWT